jgi:hypothetical protein
MNQSMGNGNGAYDNQQFTKLAYQGKPRDFTPNKSR